MGVFVLGELAYRVALADLASAGQQQCFAGTAPLPFQQIVRDFALIPYEGSIFCLVCAKCRISKWGFGAKCRILK